MELPMIQNKIFEVRGHKVMLDFDLAELYEVETKRLNEQVRRNAGRFPEDFMFRLSESEWEMMRSQIATASNENNPSQIVMTSNTDLNQSQFATGSQKKRNTSAAPYAFIEHGVTILASVLRSKRASDMNVAIVRAFITMKQIISPYKELTDKMNLMFERLGEHDVQLAQIYNALENMLDKEAEKTDEKLKWEKRERIGFK